MAADGEGFGGATVVVYLGGFSEFVKKANVVRLRVALKWNGDECVAILARGCRTCY